MALQGLNYIIPLVTLPYLVRVLGIGPFGLISVAQAFAAYFVILTDYGFNFSATRRIAQKHDDLAAVSEIFSAVITIKAAFMVFGLCIMVLILRLVPHFRPDAAVYAVNYGTVIGSVLLPTWLFQGLQDMRTIAILNGITKLASACLLFVFVHSSRDYLVAAALPPLGVLVSGIAGLWICLGRLDLHYKFPRYSQIQEQLADGFHLFVSSASITLYTNTNVFLVGLLAGNVQAGYFSAAEKVVRGVQALLGPITQAIFPHVSAMKAQSKERALQFLRKTLQVVGAFSLVSSIGLLVFARPVALIIFGSKAAGSIPTLRWIAVLPFVVAVSNILGIQTMIPFRLDRQLSRIYITAGILSLFLSVPLIMRLGSQGAGISVTVIEVLIVLSMWRVIRGHGINLLRQDGPSPRQ